MMNRKFGRILILPSFALTVLLLLLTPAAAQATGSVNLGPSDIYGNTITYYSKSHYKSINGSATLKLTKVTWGNADCTRVQCYDDQVNLMRDCDSCSQATQELELVVGQTGTFKTTANTTNFYVGYYYLSAGNYGGAAPPPADWYGTLGGAWEN